MSRSLGGSFAGRRRARFPALGVVCILLAILVTACDGNSEPTTTLEPQARLSEDAAIGAVKALLDLESQSHWEERTAMERTMCSSYQAATDTRCQPCAPGSPNFCIDQWVTKSVEVPGRCAFPPSEHAQWSAEYFDGMKEWQVESSDPGITGLNQWTVDDQSGMVVEGYCVFQ